MARGGSLLRAYFNGTNPQPKSERVRKCRRFRRIRHEVLTVWRQSSPEAVELRRAVRQQIEQLLRGYYGKFQAEGTPQRFVELLREADFLEQNSSTED